MRRVLWPVAGPVRRLRGVEFADGSGLGPGGRQARTRRLRRRRGGADHRAETGFRRTPDPSAHRAERARPRAGRRPGGRLGGAGRRRSGHRQIDAAAAGAGQHGRAGCRRCTSRGEECLAQVAGRATRLGLPLDGICMRWPKPASKKSSSSCEQAKPTDPVADSIQTLWTRVAQRRARLGQPGARMRRAPGALRQGNRHRGVPGRPRHQGRRHRRPARARAHGRCGAVFRRRERQPLPHPARVQEPLRRGQRTGRVRDGRQRPERSAQPVRDLPVRPPEPRPAAW